jgi:exopolysaccharide biosynthesis polyprenyl glycosylphosphotransferase
MSQLRSAPDVAVPVPRAAGDSVFEGVFTPAKTGIRAGTRRHRTRSWLLPTEAATAAILGGTVARLHASPDRFAVVLVALTLITNYHMGLQTIRPGLPHLGRIVRDAALPMLAVSIGVAVGILEPPRLREALGIVGVIMATAMVATALRRVLEGPVRLVVVGTPADAARAASRLAGDKRAKVVGAVLLDASRSDAVSLSDSFGVHVALGSDDVAHWVDVWETDIVAVAGPTLSADGVRRLAWQLESTAASLAVMGVIDMVAPHRIDAASLAGDTLLHVRSSRPSTFIRGIKSIIDRVLGGVILVLVAPLLAVLSVAIRIGSPGRAFFSQTRIGRDGVPFKMYKLRTMDRDAEKTRDQLALLDQGHGTLFKIHDDPRVTRLGRFLRRTSLDELPQLINVVLGEMSLIGPRPALPAEVEQYDDRVRRRLAVRPGMTGLWQVSGRSNLSWDRSVELDLHYTDNWRLVDDLGIGVRTVDAVVRSRGAY